ncbi:hypothetical protein JCM10449v2_000475 [Rhodotorula kratochvilovae]
MATSRLEQLPPEILLQILAHLPLRRDSLRPHSSLTALASASRHLHSALTPLVNSSVRITDAADAAAFLDEAPPTLKSHVRALHLGSVTPPWTARALEPLLHSLERLTELRCHGLAEDPFAVVELLAASDATSHLELLELDFSSPSGAHGSAAVAEAAKPPWTVRADYPLTAPPRAVASPGLAPGSRTSRSPPLSHAPLEPSLGTDLSLSPLPRCSALWTFVRACLALCPELRTLRLRNLALSPDQRAGPASAFCHDGWLCSSIDASVGTRLQVLELDDVHLDDETLHEALSATSATLETLALRRCVSFTRAGLVEAIKTSGGRLRHLDLVAAEPASPPATPSPPSPLRSPPLSRASPPSPPPPPAPPPLAHIVDTLLPSLPQLTTLSLSSPSTALLSSEALSFLSLHMPHLRAVHLRTPHLSAAHALQLVQRSSGARLPALRVLALHAPSSAAGGGCGLDEENGDDDSATEALWAAALEAEVRLEGAAFERASERLEWARGAAERVAASGEPVASGRRRKRPSLL